MNIKNYLYRMRKRINDEDLLKMQKIINEEVERRLDGDSKQ